jgi:predicted nucleotidyltransferase component of viral defense system
MKSVESVKAKLKNEAVNSGRLYNEILTMYFIERILYRVSISPYIDKFVLKGGVLLYMMYDKKYPRATVDIDFLASDISNDIQEVKDIFHNILKVSYKEDFIAYDFESLKVSEITTGNTYKGVSVSVVSYLGNVKQKISIDIGFGDIVVPSTTSMKLPVILEVARPILNVYSKESVIAEKLDAIIKLGELNSRYKDYYDIYKLLSTTNFDRNILKNAIHETLQNRGTKFEKTIFENIEYVNSASTERMWNNMKRKRHIEEKLSFADCVDYINKHLGAIIEEIGEVLWK